jgi:hypothetical protein
MTDVIVEVIGWSGSALLVVSLLQSRMLTLRVLNLLARDRPLPALDPGDIVAVLDTGAYYASNPFQYNSLPLPGIYGVSGLPSAPVFDTIRAPGETEW